MPKAFFTLFATYLLLTSGSCEDPPRLLSASRGYFSAFVVDNEGVPVTNAQVALYAVSSPDNLILGNGITDGTGFVEFTSLVSDGPLNVLEVDSGTDSFSNIIYSNQLNRLTNFTHTIQLLQYRPSTRFNIRINAPSNTMSTVGLQISAEKSLCIEEWSHGEIPESVDCSLPNEFSRNLFLGNGNREEFFFAPIGSQITVIYNVDGGPDTTVNFTINGPNPTYEINL